jgi:hypothetical protein
MKKILNRFAALFVIIALFSACIGKPGERTRYVDETYPFEKFCAEFLNSHKDFNTNDITRENANKEFTRLVLDTLEKDNILKGLPVNLKSVGRCGEYITAHFMSWIKPSGFEFKEPVHEINYDIICTIPDSLSTTLKDDEYYAIDGQFVARIETKAMMDVLLGRSEMPYTDAISFEADDLFKDEIEVCMGMLYFELKSIEPFKGRGKVEEKY